MKSERRREVSSLKCRRSRTKNPFDTRPTPVRRGESVEGEKGEKRVGRVWIYRRRGGGLKGGEGRSSVSSFSSHEF